MSGANKILTVSYGTFSCTIEGFEDPFGTMKQIAEYFRDLAAEDRYFGAEPPVPDAEALRHLAEREAARRVEARMGANGVHLRQLDDAAAADAATPVSPGAMAATAVSAFSAADVLTPSEVIDPEPESVAARLSRIRAVVARARSTSVWPDEVVEVADAEEGADMAPEIARPSVSEFTPSETLMSGPVEPFQTETRSQSEDPTPQADPDAASAAMDDAIGFSPSTDLSLRDVLVEAEPGPVLLADAPDEDRVVVDFSQASSEEVDIVGDDNAVPPTGFDEPANPAEASNEVSWQQDDVVSEINDASVAEPDYLDSESAAWNAEDDWQGETAAEDLKAPDARADEEADSDGTFADPRSDIADSPAARLVALRKSDHAAAVATDRLEDVLSGRLAPQDVFAGSGDAPDDVLVEDANPADTQDERAASLLAAIRAIGVDEGETSEEATDNLDQVHSEATVEIETVETVETWRVDSGHDEEALDYAAMTAPPLRLDEALRVAMDTAPDDVATEDDTSVDLSGAWMLEVPADQLVDEFDAGDESDTTPLLLSNDPEAEEAVGEAADAADEDVASPQRAGHDLAVEDLERVPEEASVDRLLAETNSQLESTEMNRRRSAIAHLKAAVAAARADKVEPEGGTRTEDAGIGSALDKFREDLARVVRPRRPVDDGQPRAVRRMPPLMLVSEQRVDGADAPARSLDAIAGTVRPRRITTREVSSDDGEEDSSGGFAGFAESMGARDLPDMLEAAAAYTAFVEGRPSFSRPQLMQMMRIAEGADDEFSREEQLRSFGLLLRQGRIQKLKRGQFTVADDTRFRPEHRHAGE